MVGSQFYSVYFYGLNSQHVLIGHCIDPDRSDQLLSYLYLKTWVGLVVLEIMFKGSEEAAADGERRRSVSSRVARMTSLSFVSL